MKLEQYLEENNAPSTVKRYLKEIEKYKKTVLNPQEATYSEVMTYIGLQRKKYSNVQTMVCILSALKKYYSYLVAIKERKDHPAKSIRLRDNKHKEIQLQDLFSSEELETLMERKERYKEQKTRNKIIVSLLIFQGLKTGEITKLNLENIDLEQGTIYIKQGNTTNSRTLKLQVNQILLLHKYIEGKQQKTAQEKLLKNKGGGVITGEQISYLIGTFKGRFKERNLNPMTIRQSVITNLLREKDLREVQLFAGHKYPSSTEEYRENNIEELKNEVLKYHPLG
jgi:integrase/recombinase XerD